MDLRLEKGCMDWTLYIDDKETKYYTYDQLEELAYMLLHDGHDRNYLKEIIISWLEQYGDSKLHEQYEECGEYPETITKSLPITLKSK